MNGVVVCSAHRACECPCARNCKCLPSPTRLHRQVRVDRLCLRCLPTQSVLSFSNTVKWQAELTLQCCRNVQVYMPSFDDFDCLRSLRLENVTATNWDFLTSLQCLETLNMSKSTKETTQRAALEAFPKLRVLRRAGCGCIISTGLRHRGAAFEGSCCSRMQR